MAALAVDQHQHVVRRKAAQSDRPYVAGGVEADRRQIERRQNLVERIENVLFAGGLQILGADDVHRRRALLLGAAELARAGDDNLLGRLRRGRGRIGYLRRGGGHGGLRHNCAGALRGRGCALGEAAQRQHGRERRAGEQQALLGSIRQY
jgi:hypothetical protein